MTSHNHFQQQNALADDYPLLPPGTAEKTTTCGNADQDHDACARLESPLALLGCGNVDEVRLDGEGIAFQPSFSAVSKTNFASKYSLELGKLSPRSTQCTPLHRSLISIFSLKIAEVIVADFLQNVDKLVGICSVLKM